MGCRRRGRSRADALKRQSKERSLLEDEKKEKDAVVQQLQSHEKELRREMADKKKQDARLEAAITAAVRRAIREATKKNAEAAAAAPAPKTPPPASTQQ